jgi:FeS assembly SUF system protein
MDQAVMETPTEIMPEAEPPQVTAPTGHPAWPGIAKALRSVYDPEIPVNIYELGLIYSVDIKGTDADPNVSDIEITMSLTAPGCPVAGEMPGMVRDAVAAVPGIGSVDVELVWDPEWNPQRMADTAKLQLNMY